MDQAIEEKISLVDSFTEELKPGSNAMDVTVEKDGGVLKEILREGEGDLQPLAGDKVNVHYVGRLTDGTQFDSSRERGEMFEFTLGKGNVIKAWDLGVATMKKGELAVLYCKPEYAYGENGSPPKIPPNATLVFEVELFSWEGEDLSSKKDKGIIRRKITEGEGYSTPNDGAMVTVHLVGRYNENKFEDRSVTFPLGEGSEYSIIEGVERALEKFKKGEKSTLLIKPQYAFGKDGNEEFSIPGDAIVEYDVTLESFEKAKENWELDTAEKLEQANIFKTKGTNYFKAGKYKMACKQYKKIVEYLENVPGIESEQEKEQKQLLLSGNLNLAMCYLKLGDAVKAGKSCDKALEIDSKNEKGLFRRGMARLSFNEVQMAKEDFQQVLAIDPNNKAAANQVLICNRKLKEQYEREKKLYSNMFVKYTKPDHRNANGNGDVLENPGTWGEDDSNFKKNQQGKPDNSGDAELDGEDERTKEQRFVEAINAENVEMVP